MPYTAEIIAVGTELLLGNIVNTDARDVSVALAQLGINVFFHTVVGDNPARVKAAVALAKTRADIIITTGGLGPTYDDLTKQTVAEAFGKALVFNEAEAEKIRAFFHDRNLEITENNFAQAYLPEGCVIFDNGVGTAPGCAFEAEGKRILMLPGPPRECRAMIESGLVPYLKTLAGEEIFSHNIHIFGMGESAVETRFRGVMERSVNPTLAPYAKDGETMLRVTARAENQAAADALMSPVIDLVRAELGDLIYGIDTDTLENTVVTLLRERGLTLAAAESCTGGLLAKRVTDVPGASRVFRGGVTAYTNAVKTALVGVPAELIETYGVVSEQIAQSLAENIRERLGADLGIGITGVAGPGADETGNPEGRVFVALAARDGTWTRKLDLYYDRERIRAMAASHALDMARRYLTGAADVV
ncbi:MAG: competence/damage-inducible protein A [Oscillospiraceae bacterium]|jgi:nicotinamide-nucleotide amidase|nr:competence/damage-inducible protein A [Oscillospiraceae bacterium]